MKIDRLIGILSILLQQEKVTAPALAEKFEVSRRTIQRDIDDLCRAGIPLVTTQGSGGGISIMESYRMDRTCLTSGEMQAILTGLRSLDSVSGTNRYHQLMEKLSMEDTEILDTQGHIVIDLCSQYKSSLAPKFELIKEAIEGCRLLAFDYYGPTSEGSRQIEPYLLVFQWSNWYVRGYCLKRNDYRTFKLSRMLDLRICEETFVKREAQAYEKMVPDKVFPPTMEVEAVFAPETRWRLIEEYGMDSFSEMEDGRLHFTYPFADKENLFSWILSFGSQAELLEPNALREELADLLRKIGDKYAAEGYRRTDGKEDKR